MSSSVRNYNQINCTFNQKHSRCHGAIDLHTANSSNFLAILDGIVTQDARDSIQFFITDHDFLSNGDFDTNLKRVKYGDNTDPINDFMNGDYIRQGDEIGIQVSGGHLHFEMWKRDCFTGCLWYRVDPLNNSDNQYINRPPGYNDTYFPEINDIVLEPLPTENHIYSGIDFEVGNGLSNFHFNSIKINKADRPGSIGIVHTYYTSRINLFGSIAPTLHARDVLVTSGVNSVGPDLGIYVASTFINDSLRYNLKFDKIENNNINDWDVFSIINLILPLELQFYMAIMIIKNFTDFQKNLNSGHTN